MRKWGQPVYILHDGEMASPMKKLQYFDVTFCNIAENLESALEQFRNISEDLEEK